MGVRHWFLCPDCGYRALISGGDDCGFFVATRTVVCDRCIEVIDVIGSETPWAPDTLASYCALRCPSCDGLVHSWHDQACPRCGGRMELEAGKAPLRWD